MISDWYKDCVVYQIYPKSFCDTNGDGIGDIKGIISKLDYLKDLGINTIWISPCYPSPDKDNGYDISNYQDIGKQFGTLDDFKLLVSELHKRDMKVLMDLVVKSSSDEHPWFIESMKGKDNPYRDYYVWKDPVDGHEPNDWMGGFDLPAWKYDEKSGQYWLHTFIEGEPDLNWDNPKLRDEIVKMINWWLQDIGIDGFRCDVINLISKDYDSKHIGDGPHLHEYLHELHTRCFAPNDAMTVGEVFGLPPEESLKLTAPEREELALVFQFDHMRCGRINGERFMMREFSNKDFVDTFALWQKGLFNKGWNTLVLENHDQPRSVDRFGSVKYRKESSKLLATLVYCLQGTPFVYQGQEIGSINPVFHSLDECDDCETKLIQDHLVEKFGMEDALKWISLDSRDCARVPLSWDDSEGAGFTTGKPWIKINDFYKEVNVKKDLADPEGVYNYFKSLFTLRKTMPIFKEGDFELIENKDDLVIYKRFADNLNSVYVILNYGDNEKEITEPVHDFDLLLYNYPDFQSEGDKIYLRPWEAVVIEENSEECDE